jgi:hypothetical protein
VQDTPECIASEMMEDLSLSATEAQLIAAQITQELARWVDPNCKPHNWYS